MPNRTLLGLLVLSLALACRPACAEDPPTATLAVAIGPRAPKADQALTARLVELLQQLTEAEGRFAIHQWPASSRGSEPLVPRRQARRMPLVGSNPGRTELLVVLEVLPPSEPSQPLRARFRIVDAESGTLQGITVANLAEETVEQTARQFSQYLSIMTGIQRRPALTVAVAPFANTGRSDRLFPLENGIRDLIVSQLQVRSGALLAGGVLIERPGQTPATSSPRGTFQVLRRSSLDQLQSELAWIRSGLSESSLLASGRAPAELPSLDACYLIRGQFDEDVAGARPMLVVRGEMIDAVTNETVQVFRFKCSPANVEERLAAQIDRLLDSVPTIGSRAAPIATRFEVESLRNLVMSDLRRLAANFQFYRRKALFCLSQEHAPPLPPAPPRRNGFVSLGDLHDIESPIDADSPEATHLLQQSIDRLETILFITPDDPIATFALGYCYSLPRQGTYQPARADALLRSAIDLKDQANEILRKTWTFGQEENPFVGQVLEILARIGFDDTTDMFDADERLHTLERIEFVSDHMPGACWELLQLRDTSQRRAEQVAGHQLDETIEFKTALAAFLPKAARLAEQRAQPQRVEARRAVLNLARELARQTRDEPALHGVAIDLLDRWATGDDEQFTYLVLHVLTETCLSDAEYLAVAALYEKAAIKYEEAGSTLASRKRLERLITMARCYRLAHQPSRSLALVQSIPLDDRAESRGSTYRGFQEIGACCEALGKPSDALAAYVQSARTCPGSTPWGDVVQRIAALGGIPLSADRAIDVEYFAYPADVKTSPFPTGGGFIRITLATDGERLYLGDKSGLQAFKTATQTWESLNPALGAVTCLACTNGRLWVGTDERGLWQCDLSSGKWSLAADAETVPDLHVQSLAVDGDRIYLGVGRQASACLVEIDGRREATIFAGQFAPRGPVTDIVVTRPSLLVRAESGVCQWSFLEKRWLAPEPRPVGPPDYPRRLFSGADTVWASANGRELFRWGATPAESTLFQKVSNPPGHCRSHYSVNFVAQRGDDVWFGGYPRDNFISSGVYRVNLKTGVVDNFGPQDGFRGCSLHRVDDGLWLGDRLWLATSEGLCVVKERK